MRAWKRWSWPSLKVQSTRRSLDPNPCWNHAPCIIARGGHDSSAGTPTLKGELRRLYKLIHPDLLHNQPAQQATNQKSFQLLQEYLSSAKGGGDAKRFIYHFEFYIRSNERDNSLEKVEVSLPPPQTRGSFHEHEILPTTRKAIGKLFAACGLAMNQSGVEESSSLPDLFQEASELQRQSEGSQLNLQQQLSLISNALYIGRGVRVLFRAPVEEAHLDTRVQLLERMAKAMDGCTGVNLSGSTFIIGNCYKVDFLGRLWLNSEDDFEVWVQFIHQADLVTASSRRLAAKSRQAREEKAAHLMGVALVFADDALALHPDYSFFLNRVEDGAAEHGVVGGGRFAELPVRVSEVESASIDENMGCVTVPVSEEFTSLYMFIQESGDKALGHRRRMKLTENRLEDLRKHVRMKLRLRHLRFDGKLNPDQVMSACTRLSTFAPRLITYTEGLSLCISDENRLPSDASGYFLHMKWNFSLDHL